MMYVCMFFSVSDKVRSKEDTSVILEGRWSDYEFSNCRTVVVFQITNTVF